MMGAMASPNDDGPVNPDELFAQFGDLFGDLFGGARWGARSGGAIPRDLQLPLGLTLEEAVDGGTKEVEVARFFACEPCGGRGAPAEVSSTVCGECGGEGRSTQARGFFSLQTTCPQCQGRGVHFESFCRACSGTRGETRWETLSVSIPPGVAAGQRLRLRGKGNELHDGKGPGDLYVAVDVGPHEQFSREGADLLTTVVVTNAMARDGGVVSAPVPGGTVEVRVPAGLANGAEVRLAGYGAVKLGSPKAPRPTGKDVPYRSVGPSPHRGDLVVQFAVEGHEVPREVHLRTLGLPATATPDEMKRAFRQLAAQLHPDHAPGDVAAARFEAVSAAYEALSGLEPDSSPAPTGAAASWPIWLALGLVAAAALAVAMFS